MTSEFVDESEATLLEDALLISGGSQATSPKKSRNDIGLDPLGDLHGGGKIQTSGQPLQRDFEVGSGKIQTSGDQTPEDKMEEIVTPPLDQNCNNDEILLNQGILQQIPKAQLPQLVPIAPPPHSGSLAEQLSITGADVVPYVKHLKLTPLHIAATRNLLKAANFLIENGADLEAKDRLGYTPLHHAGSYNFPLVADLLIRCGANVEAQDNMGWTPLHWAAYKNSLQVAQVLIQKARANKDAETKSGFKPIHFAKCSTSPDYQKCSKMRNLLQ